MHPDQFAALAARLTAHVTRRHLGALGLLGVASAGAVSEVAGKKKKKGKKKGKKRKGTTTSPPATTTSTTTSGPQATFICRADSFFVTAIAGATRTAQTFTATRSGALQRIRLSTGKPPGSSGDFVVQLLLVIGNTPSDKPQEILAEAIVPNAAVSENNGATVEALFTDGPQLTAGAQYAVALSRPGPSTYDRAFSDEAGCSGRLFEAAPGQEFVAQGAQTDAMARVYVV